MDAVKSLKHKLKPPTELHQQLLLVAQDNFQCSLRDISLQTLKVAWLPGTYISYLDLLFHLEMRLDKNCSNLLFFRRVTSIMKNLQTTLLIEPLCIYNIFLKVHWNMGGKKTSGTVKKLMMINDWDKLLFS